MKRMSEPSGRVKGEMDVWKKEEVPCTTEIQQL